MLWIAEGVEIADWELSEQFMRASGPGGQNVNKVSSAIHLRFDIGASSLPDDVKDRLLALNDNRITRDGVLVIKSQEHRSQDMNRIEAFSRLMDVVQSVAKPPKKRKPTKPTFASKQRRLEGKKKLSEIKSGRSRVL